MARNLVVGDTVYVPCKLLELEDQPFALYATEVQSAEGRSVTVRLPGGERSRLIGSSRVHNSSVITHARHTDANVAQPLGMTKRPSVKDRRGFLFSALGSKDRHLKGCLEVDDLVLPPMHSGQLLFQLRQFLD